MRRTTVAALAVTMAVITAVSAHSLHAQATQQPDLHFDVTLAVPISVKAVHPDIYAAGVHCNLQPPGGTWGQGVVWNDPGRDPIANMSGGQFSGTLTVHLTAHRSATFVAGEVWSYTCILEFFKKASATSGDSDVGSPGVGPSFRWWAQLATGSDQVSGTFTLQ